LTSARADQGLPDGQLEYVHYKAIHRHLFQRHLCLGWPAANSEHVQGRLAVLPSRFIDGQMTQLLDQLAAENFLQGLVFPAAAKRAAHYIVELNAIHPFREGNGRTQHAFRALLLERAGHPRDLSRINPAALLQAAIDGFDGDERPMEKVIGALPPRRSPSQ
jgi:cell filamentation protein